MEAFSKLSGVAAPFPVANVDTDKIIPARFMKTIQREGLGRHLFDALRYHDDQERADFVLNLAAYRHATILITHENFGCGSSREHAPWALLDFGIRCIIAPSFADIFYFNCFKNGILPVRLPRPLCDALMAEHEVAEVPHLTVDLERQIGLRPSGEEIRFEADAFRRNLLLNGYDDISLTMQHLDEISAFEQRRREGAWLFPPIHL